MFDIIERKLIQPTVHILGTADGDKEEMVEIRIKWFCKQGGKARGLRIRMPAKDIPEVEDGRPLPLFNLNLKAMGD